MVKSSNLRERMECRELTYFLKWSLMERMICNSEEASALLGVSQSSLLRLSKAKKLNKIRISSKRVGWSRSDLLRFIADCETHNITMTQT